jgi:hypothetical protein
LTVFTALASGCLDGDVARPGIGKTAPLPVPVGFAIRDAEGVENEDESLGPPVIGAEPYGG